LGADRPLRQWLDLPLTTGKTKDYIINAKAKDYTYKANAFSCVLKVRPRLIGLGKDQQHWNSYPNNATIHH
jgi:hypothetical protein